MLYCPETKQFSASICVHVCVCWQSMMLYSVLITLMSSTCCRAQAQWRLTGRLGIIVLSDLKLMSWNALEFFKRTVKSCLFQGSLEGLSVFLWRNLSVSILFFSNLYKGWKMFSFKTLFWFHLPFQTCAALTFPPKMFLFKGRFSCFHTVLLWPWLTQKDMKRLWNHFLRRCSCLLNNYILNKYFEGTTFQENIASAVPL